MPPALLWGAGTAIGEIPPYAFSYHAAKAGIRNEEWDSMFQVTPVSEGQGLIEALIHRMKNWMLRFIQKWAPCPLQCRHLQPCRTLQMHCEGCMTGRAINQVSLGREEHLLQAGSIQKGKGQCLLLRVQVEVPGTEDGRR